MSGILKLSRNEILGFPCLGGKTKLISRLVPIINFIGTEHNLNCAADLCGGGGKITTSINPYIFKTRLYSDLDRGLYSVFKVLTNETETKYLICKISNLIKQGNYKSLFDKAYNLRNREDTDIITSAAYTIICIYGSFNSNRKSFSRENFEKHFLENRIYLSLEKYNSIMSNVIVKNYNCFDFLNRYHDREDILAILDVPYEPEVMKSTNHYEFNFTTEMHKELVQILTSPNFKMKYILCGYKTDIYKPLEKGENRIYYLDTINLSSQAYSGKSEYVKEYIWTNFYVPSRLLK